MGVSGKGTISVDSPTQLRGETIWVLHSDMRGTLGPISAKEQNASWLNPATMTSLRYTSSANHLWKRSKDAVDIFAAERRWKGVGGLEGTLVTEAPLDELSFLFFLRTLALSSDTALTYSRHFDEARNPTLVRVVGREEVEVGAGRFHAIVVEMRVRDPRRYHGEGVIRVYLSDDQCRLLLRLESSVPDAGSATLGLTAYEGARESALPGFVEPIDAHTERNPMTSPMSSALNQMDALPAAHSAEDGQDCTAPARIEG